MTLRSALLIGLVGVAAACGSPAVVSDASATPHTSQSAAAVSAGPSKIQAGEWHSVITYTSVTGMPPAMARSMMARPHPVDGCSSDGDINGAVQDAISGAGNMTCTEDSGSAANGVISGVATCHDDDGNSGHLSISGTYTSTHVVVNGDLAAQTQIGPVSEHIHLVSDHTGAVCTGDNDN